MNNNWENTDKMDAVYEQTEDETMEEGLLDSIGTIPTWHSARLAAKLEKLWQTNLTIELSQNHMEINKKEQKKQARAITPGAHKLDIAKQDQKTLAPEIKKLWNNETPPRPIARRARAQEARMTHMETDTAEGMIVVEQGKESLQEQEKPPEESTTMAMQTGTMSRQDESQLAATTLAVTNENNTSTTRDEAQMAQGPEEHQQDTAAE